MAKTKWSLDPMHSELGFKIRHLMITNVSGNFNKFNIEVEADGDDFASAKVKADIDVDSINTNNEQRDAHLRNADFFETGTHPKVDFKSTKVEKAGEDTFNLYGDLTIKGITKPVKLSLEHAGLAKDPWGNLKAGFSVSGKINRKDFGISFNSPLETGGVALGEEIKINGEIQMIKQAELQPA
ncbi:MAG: YceI family protein [Bacteroidota bacterium]